MIPCPHCGNTESRIRDVRNYGGRIRRSRICKHCSGSFTTFETLAVYAGRSRGMVLDVDAELQRELINQPSAEVNG